MKVTPGELNEFLKPHQQNIIRLERLNNMLSKQNNNLEGKKTELLLKETSCVSMFDEFFTAITAKLKVQGNDSMKTKLLKEDLTELCNELKADFEQLDFETPLPF